VLCVRVIPIPAQVDITGFESPAAEHHQLGLSLDVLLVTHPSATFIGLAPGEHDFGCYLYRASPW
jgi:DNA polymerase V